MMSFAALVMSALVAQASPTPPQAPPVAQSAGDRALAAAEFDQATAAYEAAYAANHKDANAALGLGTMALYRNDLANAKTYLTAAVALAPDDARAKRRLDTIAQRQADQTDLAATTITVPFIVTDPLPLVHVTLDGKTATFMLDTGGSGIGIAPETAKRLGLKVVEAGEGVFAGGRTAKVYRTLLPSFSVGVATLKDITVNVMPGGPMTMAGHHVDGVLGTGFLTHFVSTIDYKHARLILRPRSSAEAFLNAAKENGSAVEPLWLVGDHFIFAAARVNDAPAALFNIDTGGGGIGVQLTKAQIDAAHVALDTSHESTFSGGGGAARTIPFAATVAIGNVSKPKIPGIYFADGDQYGIFPFTVAGTISHEFFKGSAVTFDFKDMKLIVTP